MKIQSTFFLFLGIAVVVIIIATGFKTKSNSEPYEPSFKPIYYESHMYLVIWDGNTSTAGIIHSASCKATHLVKVDDRGRIRVTEY